MMACNICSLNCNGIRDPSKRKQVFSWLHSKNCSIFFIQETHSLHSDEQIWKQEWGGPVYYSHGTNDSRGVAILFEKHVNFEILDTYGSEGRILMINLNLSGKEITLLNLYAPNKDDITFFQKVATKLLEADAMNMIIGGDFNLVLDLKVDKKGGLEKTHTNSCNFLKQFMGTQNVIDIWRIQHLDTRQFTWRRRNPYPIHCRLDMFLVSDSIQCCIVRSSIVPGYRSDHSLVIINCTFSEIDRGPGYWKLNCSLLQDQEYLNMIKNIIKECTSQFEDENLTPDLFWEMLKMEFRRNSINYSARKKREHLAEQQTIETEINNLEQNTNKTDQEHDRLQYCKNLMQIMYNDKIKGSIIRSRTIGYEHGDRPSSYFLNLEKSNQARKAIYKLRKADGTIIDNKNDILQEICSYYTKLYCQKNCYNTTTEDIKKEFLPRESHVKLSKEQKDSCEGLITKAELTEALHKTKNNKSPGIDGIPYEFYKMFWNDISKHILESINYSYRHGLLSINQRRGVISLLPKGNKDTLQLTNWRPITLLCTDFKLASKVIASRLKQTLSYLINSCQTGFVSGRYIGENINTILEIIEIAEEENIPGLILSADFSKAFDNLDWDYLRQVLKYFNFGESFQQWIQLFNTNVTAVVNVNGWFTSYFNIEKGARQGDPIAAYLFILCAELLGHKFRTDTNIIGINIGDNEYKICQFADDTVIFLDGTQVSLDRSLDVLLHFSYISGLAINFQKTNVYKIGQLRYMQGIFNTKQALNWSNDPLETLGIKIPILNRNEIFEINYQPKVRELELKLKRWANRHMSLKGKVTIVKTFGISKILYLASVLPFPPENIITNINKLIYSFIWNNKPDKIKRDVLINTFENGGLNLPHFETFCKSLKITWVKRYIMGDSNTCQWIKLIDYRLRSLGGKIVFQCNLKKVDLYNFNLKSIFWNDVLTYWCEYNFLQNTDIECFNSQIIWMNSHIRVDNKVLYHAGCIENQMLTITNLYHEGKLLDRNLINIIYDVNITAMAYNSIISAIPREWKRQIARNTEINNEIVLHDKYHKLTLMPSKHVSKNIYKELLLKQTKCADLQEKWLNYIDNYLNMTNRCFTHIYNVTIDNILRSFQYKLLHRIIYFNDKLLLFNVVDSNTCDSCNVMTDSIEHRMWLCPNTKDLWKDVIQWYNEQFDMHVLINYFDVITNICNNSLLEFIILCTKYYIYKCFIQKKKLLLKTLIEEIYYLEKIEKEIAYRKNKITLHIQKWGIMSTV